MAPDRRGSVLTAAVPPRASAPVNDNVEAAQRSLRPAPPLQLQREWGVWHARGGGATIGDVRGVLQGPHSGGHNWCVGPAEAAVSPRRTPKCPSHCRSHNRHSAERAPACAAQRCRVQCGEQHQAPGPMPWAVCRGCTLPHTWHTKCSAHPPLHDTRRTAVSLHRTHTESLCHAFQFYSALIKFCDRRRRHYSYQ